MSKNIKLVTTGLAILTLVAGLGIGLYALIASLGVWFGAWDFRRGFDMLRLVNSNAATVAIVCLIATVLVFALARKFQRENSIRLGSIALIGTLAATAAYYVPESYRPGEGILVPPIHDITTDTQNPPQFVAVLALRGPGTNTVVYGTGPNMTPERLTQLQTEAYPDIQPVLLSDSKADVFNRALAAVDAFGWELVDQNLEDGRIEATDTTFWFRFKDDVVIIINETAEGTLVNARSVSRVGVGDVGKNAARLRAFFAAL